MASIYLKDKREHVEFDRVIVKESGWILAITENDRKRVYSPHSVGHIDGEEFEETTEVVATETENGEIEKVVSKMEFK